MDNFFHHETRWKEARKMKNLSDALFALTSLWLEVGNVEYDCLRYRRCFNLASALEYKIVERWGSNK